MPLVSDKPKFLSGRLGEKNANALREISIKICTYRKIFKTITV